jgi:hypothetical protein
MLNRVIDPDFTPTALQDRVVLGAEQRDPVRLHGAITAALNLYPHGYSYAHVFAPGLDRLDGDAWLWARDAINRHLLDARRQPAAYRRPPLAIARPAR